MTDNKDNGTNAEQESAIEDVGAGGDGEAQAKDEVTSSPMKNGADGGGDAIAETTTKEETKPMDVSDTEDKAAGDSKENDGDKSLEESVTEEKKPKETLFEGPVVVEGKRNRKKTARLSDAIHKEAIDKEKEVLKQNTAIPAGTGVKLADIPYINYILRHRMKNDDLTLLHRVLFNIMGTRTTRKNHIKEFCGFEFKEGTVEYDNKLEFLNRIFLDEMKRVVLFPLGIKSRKNKEETAKAVLDFLMEPKDLNTPIPLTKKQKKVQKEKDKEEKKKAKAAEKQSKVKAVVEDESEGEEGDDEDTVDSDDKAEADGSEHSEGDNDDDEKPKKKVKKKTEKKPKTEAKKTTKKKETKEKETKKKKTPKKKETAKTPKKTKSPKKKTEEELSSLSSDSDSDDEPLMKKAKKSDEPPTDDELKDVVKRILDSSDLEDLSIRKVFQQVSDMYPQFDLSDRQKFIKKTVKELIN